MAPAVARANASDADKAGHMLVSHGGDDRLGAFRQKSDLPEGMHTGAQRANDRAALPEPALQDRFIADIALDKLGAGQEAPSLPGIADKRHDPMAAGLSLPDNFPASGTGGPDDENFHGCVLRQFCRRLDCRRLGERSLRAIKQLLSGLG